MTKFKLNIIEHKIVQGKAISDEVIVYCKSIENTLLQNDKSALVEEQLVSISLSTGSMYLAGMVFSFTGAGLAFMGLGFLLSRQINKKLYGKERSFEELNIDEQQLICRSREIKNKFDKKKLWLSVRSKYKHVLFAGYVAERRELKGFLNEMNTINPNGLAFKYRANYTKLTQAKAGLLAKFDNAYTL